MESIDEIKKEQGLPQFLKVLCILTFIGSGLGILLGLIITLAFPVVKNIPVIEGFESFYIFLGIYTIFINAGTLAGALLMWKKNVIGFYVYVTAQLANIASSVIFKVFFDIDFDNQNLLTYIFPIAFIAMYASNYKYFKNYGNN